ncbi:MAG: glycosyltransferase, partial [Candidatus Thermoplasmatota archaeon]|nr:glycosyltransferase [Candidatus Thermoplasmatota archaeon]
AKRKTGLPLVHTFHTDFLNMRWTLKGRLLNSMFIDIGWAYSCAMYRRGDAVIAPTDLMRQQLKPYNIPVPIHVVWDGIDPAHYSPPPKLDIRKRYRIEEGAPVVLFLSRLTRDKGVYTLLKAAKKVHKATGAVFIVAGTGPESHDLPRKAMEERMQDCFKVVGFVSEEEKLALYHQSDVFVLPSRAETFGMVLLEAMACKTPAIGAASGGITEVIRDGKNGLLFKWGDAEELAEKIINILEDNELRQRLVGEGWRFVNNEASIDASAKKTVEIYEGFMRK